MEDDTEQIQEQVAKPVEPIPVEAEIEPAKHGLSWAAIVTTGIVGAAVAYGFTLGFGNTVHAMLGSITRADEGYSLFTQNTQQALRALDKHIEVVVKLNKQLEDAVESGVLTRGLEKSIEEALKMTVKEAA